MTDQNDLTHWRVLSMPFLSFGPLLTPSKIFARDQAAGAGYYHPGAISSLDVFARYVVHFLTAAHPDLGRAGAVCPFMAGSLKRDMALLTASSLDQPDATFLLGAMDRLRSVFLAQEDSAGAGADEIYRAIVVVFPDLPPAAGAELIEHVQKTLKPAYIEQGLMIGEFYPTCPAPGLHNSLFRPMQTPVLSLAIRHMTLQDAPFMLGDPAYIAGYTRLFGQTGMDRISALQARRANEARASEPSAVRLGVNDRLIA